MNKNSLLLEAVLLVCAAVIPRPLMAAVESTEGEAKYAEMTFEATTHNFGVFDIKDGFQSCCFYFKNTGNAPLVIKNTSASCGCTTPEVTLKPIPPGARDSVKVSYDGTTRRPGVFRKTIIIETNAKVNSSYLYITGEMTDTEANARLEKELEENKKKSSSDKKEKRSKQ